MEIVIKINHITLEALTVTCLHMEVELIVNLLQTVITSQQNDIFQLLTALMHVFNWI